MLLTSWKNSRRFPSDWKISPGLREVVGGLLNPHLDFFLGQTGDFKVESFSVSFIEDVYSVSALPKLPTRFTSHDCFEFPMIGKSDGRHGLSGFRYLARMAGRLNRADEFLVA